MTEPILTEAERRAEIVRETAIRTYADANRVDRNDKRLHVYELPQGSLVTIGPMSPQGWAGLAAEAIARRG